MSIFLRTVNATERDLTTGKFKWFFENPLILAAVDDPRSLEVGVSLWSYTNFFINVTTGSNDLIWYSDDTGDEDKYIITLPQGQYSVESMNSYIQTQLIANGHSGLFSFVGDYATNKLYVQWGPTLTGWFITMTAQSPNALTGFTLTAGKRYIPTDKSNSVNEINYADTTAAFNQTTSIALSSNLGAAILTDGAYKNVMLISVPEAAPGFVNHDEPTHISYADCNNLKGVPLSFIEMSVTDQDNNAVTLSEDMIIKLAVRLT